MKIACVIGAERLEEAGELIGIRVLDHVIVAERGFHSFDNHVLGQIPLRRQLRHRDQEFALHRSPYLLLHPARGGLPIPGPAPP